LYLFSNLIGSIDPPTAGAFGICPGVPPPRIGIPGAGIDSVAELETVVILPFLTRSLVVCSDALGSGTRVSLISGVFGTTPCVEMSALTILIRV
jgi:hypothetical protein